MLYKTRGIALSYIKYKDTSIISKIYTEHLGLQSYIQNGVRSSSSKTKIALFQPLTLLDLVVYHKERQEIHRISEIKCAYFYQTLHTDIKKITVSAFLTEVLMKCLHQDDKSKELFHFLFESMVRLDGQAEGSENFHIHFLFSLARYLGFQVHDAEEMASQIGSTGSRSYNTIMEPTMHHTIDQLILAGETFENQAIDRHTRALLLDVLMEFYRLHIDNFGEVKSLKILREL